MIFDPTTAPHLKPWLVRTLEPICDAEPGALADYILALLKHNVPETEMRKELASQLEEFLENEVPSFIDTLFTALRTKSYLPYTAATPPTSYPSPSQDTGIPIPLDALLSPSGSASPDRGRKRSNENDERDGRPPAKGPRLSTEGQFSRYTNGGGGDARSTGGWGGRDGRAGMNGHGQSGHMSMPGSGNMAGGMNGYMGYTNGRRPQSYQPPDQKRGICRDYHNNGFCARGEFCRYSHGEDAVVPGQLFPMNVPAMGGVAMPFMPMFPGGGMPFAMGGGAGAAYDPHEARMDMRPQQGGRMARAPIMPRIPQENGHMLQNVPGELPVIQDLTPEVPLDVPTPQDSQSVPEDSHRSNGFLPTENMDHMVSPHPPFINGPADIEMLPPMGGTPVTNSQRNTRGGRPARGRGAFGDAHNFRPERRNDKTLVVEKIPDDKINLPALNEWFKKFGTVTNVAIDSKNKKALVSFSEHSEAHAAWKSEDAVFNNRFVKLFWHRPMEGHGQAGARMLAASAPLVANIAAKDSVSTSSTASPPSSSTPASVPSSAAAKKPSTPSAAATALATKQQLLEQQIAEQKSLMASLTTASADEKKQIMMRLRKLGEEMKPTSSAPSPDLPNNARIESTPQADDHERKIKERLDKELELHSAAVAAQGGVEEKETTEDLKARLAKLKAEAASLGLPEVSSQPAYSTSHRPYRGRGRASRSYYRGAMRGGPPRGSMTLDNRPKKLLVKGAGEDGLQAVHDWYESTGLLDQVENDGNGGIVVSFKTRLAAEQGLSKGANIPTIGKVQVTWLTMPQTNAVKNTLNVQKSLSQVVPPTDTFGNSVIRSERAHSAELETTLPPHMQDEEVVASGWGGDGDGEDGMGML